MDQSIAPNLPRVPELLAPAGGREQFYAALNAGADAVYLGLKAFNARARAENFTPEDLSELVPLAHQYGMQVLVTVNVLVKQGELKTLLATLSTLEALEVDAIIVQDLAVAALARRYFPQLRLHASTQMAVHNLAGVLQARDAGFRRVVLARELTAQELRLIRAAVPRDEVEIEAFCHGSLCYSYSGLCFFSGAGDARSGNRGECAYTCRQPYKIVSEPGHGFLFSMRDLDTSAQLDLLIKAGVDTLKIEGRKKDAQYVSSVVRLYRERLDALFGMPTLRASAPKTAVELSQQRGEGPPVSSDLALSFQRQPTSLFVQGRYHENVIDLDNPTHAGVALGQITAVRGALVTTVTQVPLERFDGLRHLPQQEGARTATQLSHTLPQHGATVTSKAAALQVTYDNKHTEFSLREMLSRGKRVVTAAPGERVDIAWPEGAALPKVGDWLYKVRSADLKRRVAQLTEPPAEAKLKPVRLITITVQAEGANGELKLTAIASKWGQELARVERRLAAAAATGEQHLALDVEQLFQLLGDYGLRSTETRFEGDAKWFVPRSLLKQLKQALGEAVDKAYDSFLSERLAHAESCLGGLTPVSAVKQASVAVKSDRLETLRAAAAFAAARHEVQLAELVFEPKRAFLTDLAPQVLATQLVELSQESGLPLRLALPVVIRAWDEPLLKRWFKAAIEAGITRLEVANIGALQLLRSWGLDLSAVDLAGDFTLYSLNAVATRFWLDSGLKQLCLSIEDDRSNLAAHVQALTVEERAALQVILYKDTPLFIAEACSLTALHGGCPTAKVCGYRSLEVENPQGERFHVAHESCKSIVYGDEAFAWTEHQEELKKLGIGRFRVDFLTRAYDEASMQRVLTAIAFGTKLPRTHGANYQRTLL